MTDKTTGNKRVDNLNYFQAKLEKLEVVQRIYFLGGSGKLLAENFDATFADSCPLACATN